VNFAVQDAPDEFGQAQILAPRFFGPTLLGLSREAERHGYAAGGQFRSGHGAICMILSYTLSRPNFLAVSLCVGHGRRVRDKESTAITITLPRALDRALQSLADQKHCGNKSAAIREVLYKEAGMKAELRLNEKADNTAVANAERRSAKYGSRKKKSRK
jgi:predicted transcriptional regulator